LQRLRSALAMGVAAGAVALTHAWIPVPPPAEAVARFVPRPQVARLASLGFEPLVADYYWMQAVQVVGAETRDPSRHAPLLGRLVDVVTTVDPWVDHPYRFAAHWLTDSPESVRFANRLLRRGIRYHPDDWRNRFYLGFNRFFYLGEVEAAAEALEAAALLPDAPLYLPRLAARLRAHTSGLDTASAFLEELLRGAEDPRARAHYEESLLQIEVERRARLLDGARERFRERNGRDIRSVEDLARGPGAVLGALPAEPSGAAWILDEPGGRIVSSRYGRRYEPFMNARDLQRRERWSGEPS